MNPDSKANNLFQRMDERIELDRDEGDVALFLALMLKLEFTTKLAVSAMIACIGDDSDRHRYSMEHELVRASSLGDWANVLNKTLLGPPAQVILQRARYLARDLTQHVGSRDWRYSCIKSLNEAALSLDVTTTIGAKVALRQYFDIAAQIRNRTRGHGAPTASQCSRACPRLEESLCEMIENVQVLKLAWAHIHRNLSGKYRVSPLLNDCSAFDYLKRTRDVRLTDGVYLDLTDSYGKAGHIPVSLLFTDTSLTDIFLPNGNFRRGEFDTLSYATNAVIRRDGSLWQTAPKRLRQSETEGRPVLDPIGSTFTNIPPAPVRYITRPDLERRLECELKTPERHPILTLTGPGGIGKTTIALKTVHEIAMMKDTLYDVILWVSARDIDLLDVGPRQVSRRVFTREDIARAVVELLEPQERQSKNFSARKFFEGCLRDGAAGRTLFVLDNFETLQDPVDTVEWLDAHIRCPNKVLITTRFRDFRGDYPIEIGGMTDEEAFRLIDQHASVLGIESLLTSKYKNELVVESEGHPYVLKILLGQVSVERKAVHPRRIIATSDQLLNALFRRTYNALTPAAQRVYLVLCSWRVVVPEIAVEAVSLRPGTERFQVSDAIDELVKFSLVENYTSEEDHERFVGVPLAAAIYGRRELEVSPLKVAVEEDLKILRDFGAGKREDAQKGVLPRIENLVHTVARRASINSDELQEALPILEYLATRFPATYLRLADLVLEVSGDRYDGGYDRAIVYVREFLKEASVQERREAWMRLARLCRGRNDHLGEIHAICEATLQPTVGLRDLGESANQINNRIRELKAKGVDAAWSAEVKELLTRVADRMERKIGHLSATECSRLAWLYLNTGSASRALVVAKKGVGKDPENYYCQNLVERLEK